MSNFSLKEEEIFFGFIGKDGERSPMVDKQPSLSRLETLWRQYPEYFCHRCDCGKTRYVFSHIVRDADILSDTCGRSYVRLFCPDCAKLTELGANPQLAENRNKAISGR